MIGKKIFIPKKKKDADDSTDARSVRSSERESDMMAGNFEKLKTILESLRTIEQHHERHPEGDVFNHTVQVTLKAHKEASDKILTAAALLHDIGKATTLNERGNMHGHEKESIQIIEEENLLEGFAFSPEVKWLVENHLRVVNVISGEMRTGKAREVLYHAMLPRLIHLRRCDLFGRNPNFQLAKHEPEFWEIVKNIF